MLLKPLDAAPPVVVLNPDDPARVLAVVGSGFLVATGSDTLFLTAAHVVDAAKAEGELGFPIAPPDGEAAMPLVPVTEWVINRDTDIAVGRHGQPGLEGFALYSGPIHVNRDVITIEHSGGLRTLTDPDDASPAPLLRKGNVVQAQAGIHPAYPAVRMLELSYPALKGASGSPVLDEVGQKVLGLVIANRERELMPAQVLSTVTETGDPVEEVRYFLPNAIAVAHEHIEEAVNEAAGVA